MDERILVPLDGSKAGEASLAYVEDLLSKLSPEVQAEIILFHVLSAKSVAITSIGGAVEFPYTEKQIEETSKTVINYLEKTGESLRSKGAKVTAKVAFGDASEEIIKASEGINANLIAMSTHGRSGISRWAFGSITDKVLRHGGITPVAVVKALE
jgi:nucleotide-binding universal stress UspA family protein